MGRRPLVIVFSQLQVGGVQKKIVDLVNELNLASDLPIYILLYRKGKYNLIRQINNPRVQVISYLDRIKVKLPIFFPIFVFWQMLMIRPKAVLVSLDYCVLPVIWTKLVLFWLKIKVVISEDQIPSENMKSQNWYKLRKKLMTVFYPMVEMIVTPSKAAKVDLHRIFYIDLQKMKVIKNWTKLIDKEISIVKRKRWDLIYVGRFDPVKNLDRLVRVVWKMKKEGRKVSSLFLGDGKERDKLKQMVVRLNLTNNIEFRGPVDNVEWYLNRAKIFVLTSKTEASPLAILEAMAVGVPVVVPNYSGAEELVANKKTGFIYQNEQEMLDIITRLLRDNKLREKITRTARSYVKANHSKKIIQQYIRILTN